MIGKLLGIATVGSSLASVGLLHRLLSGIMTVVVLAVVTAFMICVLLAGGFYMGYICLIHYGLDPTVAGVTVGGIALVITIVLVAVTASQMQRLKDLSHPTTFMPHLALPTVSGLVDAFLDGLLTRHPPARQVEREPEPLRRRRA